jgi:leucyl/phenylalanyl-tRNA---protein transferase
MSVFLLSEALKFPLPELADADGLLAVGGDLSPERLLMAYRMGIFPWYAEDTPILWWSPDPRLVLFPDELKISKSLQRVIARGVFQVTVNRVFREVIEHCAEARRGDDAGTWLVPGMIEAYCRLHQLGYAHSVESWHQGRLVGGLYGIALGRVFYGESMFTLKTDASKVALVHLVRILQTLQFEFIDCQVTTHHLKSLGAREILRQDFLTILAAACEGEDLGPSADRFTAAHLMQVDADP